MYIKTFQQFSRQDFKLTKPNLTYGIKIDGMPKTNILGQTYPSRNHYPTHALLPKDFLLLLNFLLSKQSFVPPLND